MKVLNRDSLLKKEELKKEKVDLGDGNFVYVRQMTAKERDSFEQSITQPIKNKKNKIIDYETSLDNFKAKLAVCTLCDENGEALLKPEDAETLGNSMSAARMDMIIIKAQKLNKITDEDKEDLVKN